MRIPKVYNMTSSNGNKIANQFVIDYDETTDLFQSYDSIIAKVQFKGGRKLVTLDKNYWDYSTTTGKYRNIYLQENKAQTLKKIKSGEYKLADLNSKR